jgi:thioredoxin-dependent peroxiredoxin
MKEAAMERTGVVTFFGNPLTLVGPALKAGDKAPDAVVLDKELKEVHISQVPGKVRVISVTPSIDTPVCDLQARRFNREATALGAGVAMLNVSMDLPFALARYAGSGVEAVTFLSDHRDASFGNAYGVLIKELRLLTRAVFVIDGAGAIRYMEIVPEVTNEPDYGKAIEAIKKLV